MYAALVMSVNVVERMPYYDTLSVVDDACSCSQCSDRAANSTEYNSTELFRYQCLLTLFVVQYTTVRMHSRSRMLW
jgi:hypothetical protein